MGWGKGRRRAYTSRTLIWTTLDKTFAQIWVKYALAGDIVMRTHTKQSEKHSRQLQSSPHYTRMGQISSPASAGKVNFPLLL